jgi:hypothetical protein
VAGTGRPAPEVRPPRVERPHPPGRLHNGQSDLRLLCLQLAALAPVPGGRRSRDLWPEARPQLPFDPAAVAADVGLSTCGLGGAAIVRRRAGAFRRVHRSPALASLAWRSVDALVVACTDAPQPDFALLRVL